MIKIKKYNHRHVTIIKRNVMNFKHFAITASLKHGLLSDNANFQII